jgi:polyhydroxybutyrate depolymerase
MDYRLACSTDVFAAIGPVSGTLQGSCPHPEKVSVIDIHGSADTHVPYNGGVGSGPGHVDGLSIPAVNEMWRKVDECANPSMRSSGVVTTSVAPCPDGRSVDLITVAGAGHQWPGSPDRPVVQRLLHTDTPSTALNATQTIWEFFSNHPKRPSN